MIPEDSIKAFTVETEPSKTYRLNIENNTISGICDGKEAVKQAVYKILNTERYKYVIYSRNYGSEFEKLYGKQMSYVKSIIKSVITDALMADDRIKNISNFIVEKIDKTALKVDFTVESIFGDIDISEEVRV